MREDVDARVIFNVLPRRADDYFHCAPIAPALDYGLEIDAKSRVMHTDDEPIPGLVAGAKFLSYSSLLRSVVFGRASGETTASWARRCKRS